LLEREQGKALGAKSLDAKSLLTADKPVPVDDTIPTVEAPLPPRRPSDLAAAMAAIAMPLPPPRPIQFAALSGGMASIAAASESRALAKPADAETPRARVLIGPNADPKAQLRALFEAVSAGQGAAPASRSAPVHVAATRVRDAAPDAVVAAAPDRVSTRFTARSPGDDLTAARFTGSATRAVATAR
jgi:hypothetical protein